MGRPRVHDDNTRRALLDAAEAIVESGGPGALSVRAVADATGTTTRAVYSGFGSKEGVLHALAERCFEILRDDIARLPSTDDPGRDLVKAALDVFRPMVIEHPSLPPRGTRPHLPRVDAHRQP
jgi:AcrR family transcriptional regulator